MTVDLFDSTSTLIDSRQITVPSGGTGFFGVASVVPIAYLTINNSSSFDVIDTVEFGAAFREPATLGQLALGLVGIARRCKAA